MQSQSRERGCAVAPEAWLCPPVAERFQRLERVVGVAPHHELVVVHAPDHAGVVDDVGEAGGAEPEPAPDVVETPHLAGAVGRQAVGQGEGLREVGQRIAAVRADADNGCVRSGDAFVLVAELRGLPGSPPGAGAGKEEEHHVPSALL